MINKALPRKSFKRILENLLLLFLVTGLFGVAIICTPKTCPVSGDDVIPGLTADEVLQSFNRTLIVPYITAWKNLTRLRPVFAAYGKRFLAKAAGMPYQSDVSVKNNKKKTICLSPTPRNPSVYK